MTYYALRSELPVDSAHHCDDSQTRGSQTMCALFIHCQYICFSFIKKLTLSSDDWNYSDCKLSGNLIHGITSWSHFITSYVGEDINSHR